MEVLFSKTLGKIRCVVAGGSVVDFIGDAIVNAANNEGLGGGGVDGAINRKGGQELKAARAELPLIDEYRGQVRIPTGDAKITVGGNLDVTWCIHAVGPRFSFPDDSDDDSDYDSNRLRQETELRTAYERSIELAIENKCRSVGFSLISAGVFRGPLSLDEVLTIGWNAVEKFVQEPNIVEQVEESLSVFLVAFTDEEQQTLTRIASGGTLTLQRNRSNRRGSRDKLANEENESQSAGDCIRKRREAGTGAITGAEDGAVTVGAAEEHGGPRRKLSPDGEKENDFWLRILVLTMVFMWLVAAYFEK